MLCYIHARRSFLTVDGTFEAETRLDPPGIRVCFSLFEIIEMSSRVLVANEREQNSD
jgi:hypothetical protein